MKNTTWATLGVFLFSILPVTAWPQQLQTFPSDQTQGSPQKPQKASGASTPKILVSPKSLQFTLVNPENIPENAVTITNNGQSNLVISSINISGADFDHTHNCATLPSGSSCTATVRFVPTSAGKKSGIMSIISNDPKKPTLNVKLKGSAASAVCTYTLASSSQSFGSGGGSGSVGVTAAAGCSWTAVSNAGWVTITSGASGSGSGTVSYSVGANSSTEQRTGTMTIAGKTFTVTQSGAEPSCSYSISPTSRNIDSAGGTGSVGVTAAPGCAWTAGSNAAWITITAGSSASGDGTVQYNVSANTSTSERAGTMTIAAKTFTVTQSGVSCTYSISPASQSFGSAGGTGSVGVTAPPGCNWTAESHAAWITVTSGASGSGNGTVNYSVGANTSTDQRTGTMTIAGKTLTVTQSRASPSCTFSISSTSQNFDSNGGTGSVGVTTQSGCNWTAESHAAWITITSGASGSGNGTVSYSVAANASIEQRTGTMMIAGQTFTVTQSGAGSPPQATLSEYQQALLDYYGEPDYLAITFGPDPPRRQETWVYLDLQKMYLFWDGESLGSTDITVDPEAYSDPPYLDPSYFTKDTKLADLVDLLGSDPIEVDQSYFNSVIGNADFKTYFFKDEGLGVAFLDGHLVSVQTVDIPEQEPVLPGIVSSVSRTAEDISALATTTSDRALMVAMIAAAVIGHMLYPELTTFSSDFWDHCDEALDFPDIVGKPPAGCTRALETEFREAQRFMFSLVATILLLAEETCGSQQTSLSQSVGRASTGNLAVATSDVFAPICPGTGIKCTGYIYSEWSECGPDGTQTRQKAGVTPQGCNIDPPFPPVLSQSCTPPCTYSIFPASESFDGGGGTGTVEVSTQNGCTFGAVSNVSWINVSSGGGSATGKIQPLLAFVSTVTYTVAANTSGSDRTGTIIVAEKPFTVNQSPCTYSISQTSESFDPGGGTGTIEVSTQSGCTFSAVSNVSWITVSSGGGSATGKIQPLLAFVSTVTYTVAANTGGSDRTGTIIVAGRTFTVNQSSCTYSISSTNKTFEYNGGAGTIEVSTQSGCTFSAVSNVSWITVSSGGGSATGKIQPLLAFVSTVTYTVAANIGTSTRTGTITVADKTFTVTQTGTPPPVTKTYSGSFSGSGSFSAAAGSAICTCALPFSGNVSMTITTQYDGTYGGSVNLTGNESWTCTSNDPHIICQPGSSPLSGSTSVGGTVPAVSWSINAGGPSLSFSGSITDSTTSGTLTLTQPGGGGGSTGLTLTGQ